MLSLEHFRRAREILAPVIVKTPLVYSAHHSAAMAGTVYFKPENMQVTGAYKIRGAYCKIAGMPEEVRARGLVTSSAGNHAQGVAYAAKLMRAAAVIVMPTTTPLVKVNNTRKHGAEVVLAGENYDEAYAHALELARERGCVFVHPFDDPEVAAGQGTIAAEILEELPEVDVILAPVGGGGLAAGVATLAKMLKPSVRVFGVEPTGAASMDASLRAGEIVSLAAVDTIADGVAVKTPGRSIFPYVRANLDGILLVDDAEIPDAFLDMTEHHKMVVENAGLLTVAALKHPDVRGKTVAAILSGGNMDVLTMATLVQHGLISRGRVFSFSLLLPDKPGELGKVCQAIAAARGNIIRMEHNQLAYINRQAAVELHGTIEAFGHEHKQEILRNLAAAGYKPSERAPGPVW